MTSTIPDQNPAVRVGVLAVQGDVREHIRVIESLGGKASPVRRPSELDAVEGLIIPGGESTTMDKLTRAFDLAEPLRERIRDGFPVYGSCAGMIMLADTIADPSVDLQGNPQQTLGGLDIVVRRNAFGRQRESFETDLAFAELPGGGPDVHAVFIRAPWVEKVGESVKVLAQVDAPDTPPAEHGVGRSTAGPVARIVAVRSGNLLATSFHPEVTGEHRIHELFLTMIAKRRAEHVGAL
ncbi:pyridoxal phosphate synthase yaaE subunit [Arthrobacter subterraneus]|uniref:Pyridoxal 5'-phosphate synthase subunit PdxT n=1 Tax=Arthrobacter subterraneus TaxID=335973 RepID=A0A1G8ECP2_9MICC|nr:MULTISPECIES: pyridoxal 5'-phosphate synthase glutaminase subunit PdxT [Arthrobacter]SDH67637.1 pyridoxal phosphate synthase yaaE subunit [Arthrobacter subterraneus]